MALFHTETHECPVCGKTVEVKRLLSTEGYVAVDLDFRVYARGADPVRLLLTRCPACAFVEYATDFPRPVTPQVRTAVDSPEYRELTMSDRASDFPLAAFVKTVKGEPSERIAYAWLRAAWFSGDLGRVEEEDVYLAKAADAFDSALDRTAAPLTGDERDRTWYLLAEINRRLGKFDRAAHCVARVSGTDLSIMIRDETNLIAKKDRRRRRAKTR